MQSGPSGIRKITAGGQKITARPVALPMGHPEGSSEAFQQHFDAPGRGGSRRLLHGPGGGFTGVGNAAGWGLALLGGLRAVPRGDEARWLRAALQRPTLTTTGHLAPVRYSGMRDIIGCCSVLGLGLVTCINLAAGQERGEPFEFQIGVGQVIRGWVGG